MKHQKPTMLQDAYIWNFLEHLVHHRENTNRTKASLVATSENSYNHILISFSATSKITYRGMKNDVAQHKKRIDCNIMSPRTRWGCCHRLVPSVMSCCAAPISTLKLLSGPCCYLSGSTSRIVDTCLAGLQHEKLPDCSSRTAWSSTSGNVGASLVESGSV